MLRVTKSNRSEDLVAPLVEELRRPSVGPFGEETVVVGADGVRRWLSKRIAQEIGICSQVRFPYAGALVREVIDAAGGAPSSDVDEWRGESLQWAILAVLPDLLSNEAFEPLRAYLDGAEIGGIKAFGLAKRLAGVLSGYITSRPDMLVSWDAGRDVGCGAAKWQPRLWRALRKHLGTPHPAERAEEFFKTTANGKFDVPEGLRRVCLFGVSSLPRAQVRVIARLAEHADVHLFMVCPSEAGWDQVHGRRDEWQGLMARDDGALDPVDRGADHPLLSSLDRLGHDFQILLERETSYESTEADAFNGEAGDTLLAQVQRDISTLTTRGSGDAAPHALDPTDDSVTFHSCHGDMRQVEVLQDQLLDLFSRHPDLEPSDVLVITPDVETFAPLIDAVFRGQSNAGHRLPVRVANRARRRENPLAEAVLRILDLAGQRLTATHVIDLLGLEAIRRKFHLDGDQVAQAGEWIRQAEIRWGVNAQDRQRKGQPGFDLNTLEWGLDRLLLGYAMPGYGSELFADRLPFDEVEGSDATVLGALVDFCQTLIRHLHNLEDQSRDLTQWGEDLRALVADLTEVAEEDAPQVEDLHSVIDQLVTEAQVVGFQEPVSHEVPRAMVADHFDQSAAATSFLTGAITVCGMAPMRSIGHRVVCLLGLDDGAFPRSASGSGFDLVTRHPAIGDRSPREDDRYLFLEALLAARSHVRIMYSGQSVRDNKPLPPSVVVSEMLDYLGQACRLPAQADETEEQASQRVVDHLVVRHPLQPFSPRYFGASDDHRLFSYASGYLDGARALVSSSDATDSFWNASLPAPDPEDTLSLWELERFFEQPVARLLRGRLGLAYPRDEEQAVDRETLVPDGLGRHQVGSGLLDQVLSGVPFAQAQKAALHSGALPPGTPGTCALADVVHRVNAMHVAVTGLRAGGDALDPLALDLPLSNTRLVGHVSDLWPGGQVRHHYASVKAKYLLSLWLRHLALHATGAVESLQSSVITGTKQPPFHSVASFDPLDPDQAREILEDLVALYTEGQRRPLLFFPDSSHAYAKTYLHESDKGTSDAEARAKAMSPAMSAWYGTPYKNIPGEGDDPFVERVFGGEPPFHEGYSQDGLEIGDELSFHDLALRVFSPLLDAKERAGS